MEKIKELLKKIAIALALVVAFFAYCVGNIGSGGVNFQEIPLRANKSSHYVAQRYLPDAEPNAERGGITRYTETFDDKAEADELFDDIIEVVNNLHSGEKLKRYGDYPEKILLCYGDENSIIVSQRDYKTKGGLTFSAITIEYVETDSYDWDYLTKRIKE